MKLKYYVFVKDKLYLKEDEVKKIYQNAIEFKRFVVKSEFLIPNFLIKSKIDDTAVLYMCIYNHKFFPLPMNGTGPEGLMLSPVLITNKTQNEINLEKAINTMRIHLKEMIDFVPAGKKKNFLGRKKKGTGDIHDLGKHTKAIGAVDGDARQNGNGNGAGNRKAKIKEMLKRRIKV